MPKKTTNENAGEPACEVILFTDGACAGNPGPGGWGFILRHPATGKEIERSGFEAETTNNRMELTAVIRGLEALKRPTTVELVSDSTYVGQGIIDWMPKWKQNGWRRREQGKWKEVKNVELWQQLDGLLASHQLRFTHIRGHSGHPENERCDQMAVAEYERRGHGARQR